MEPESDQRLLQALAGGNGEALMELFEALHRPLLRFAWRLTGSPADAEDVVQECFLALLRPHHHYNPAHASLRTYLFGAVRNQSLKRLRHPSAPPDESLTSSACPEQQAVRLELADAIARAIARLPLGQREVLILSHYEQMMPAEIATILGLEVTAVKSRLQRARATLKEALSDYSPVPAQTLLEQPQ